VLIEGGRVIDPASGLDATGDVLLAEGEVKAIATRRGELRLPAGGRRLDAEGCIVAPGLIDIHVHFREPGEGHEETVATGSAAAINGGFTTVCCMPNTTPALDTAEAVRRQFALAEAAGAARVYPVGCATKGRRGEELAPIAAMAEAGAIAFSDDGDCVASPALMLEALRAAKAADRCFMQHCQEPTLTRGASMNPGPTAKRMGQIGWPAVAEELIIERDVRLNREIGCRYHAQHVSSGESAAIIRRAREGGEPVTGEASPHHLLLTDQDCQRYGTEAKMNPPLRTNRDIERLKEAIAAGVITILATDHAPHPRKKKEVLFAEAAFGIVGLEGALPLYVQALIGDGVLDWPGLLAMMTANPAALIGIAETGFGRLAAAGIADVTVIDPEAEWTIRAEEFASTGRNCPFDGWPVKGRAIMTIVGGDVRLLREPAREQIA